MLCACVAGLTASVLAVSLLWNTAPPQTQVDAPPPPSEVQANITVAAATASHPVYRYSVISGGAHNRQELVDAIDSDPVVASHYRTISLDRVHTERLPEERRAYVSYRVGDRVFWTKHKVTLPKGEPILTDDVNQIRARCGNCISYEPQLPTSDEEPEALEFEALAPAVDETDPLRTATHPSVPSAVTLSGRTAQSDLLSSLPGGLDLSTSEPFVNSPALTNGIPMQGRQPKSIGPNLPVAVAVPDGSVPSGSYLDDLVPGDFILDGHTPATPGDFILYPPIQDTLIPGPAPSASDFGGEGLSSGEFTQPVPVPEPSTIVLLGTGVAGALWRRVRSRRRR